MWKLGKVSAEYKGVDNPKYRVSQSRNPWDIREDARAILALHSKQLNITLEDCIHGVNQCE